MNTGASPDTLRTGAHLETTMTNPDIEKLASFSTPIEESLADRNYQLFGELIRERSTIIDRMKLSGAISDIPLTLREKILDENNRWIAEAQRIKRETKAELDSIQSLETGNKHLATSYAHLSATGNFVSGAG